MDNFSITKYGKPLLKSKYTIDLVKKVFYSTVDDLVLNFTNCHDWTITTGSFCTFLTGSECIFKTGGYCTFHTSYSCTFYTDTNCTFTTSGNCTFKTGQLCIFLLFDINSCTFKSYDGISTILDRGDKKHYLLTKEFVQLQKVKYG